MGEAEADAAISGRGSAQVSARLIRAASTKRAC